MIYLARITERNEHADFPDPKEQRDSNYIRNFFKRIRRCSRIPRESEERKRDRDRAIDDA